MGVGKGEWGDRDTRVYTFSDKLFDLGIFLQKSHHSTAKRLVLFGAGGYGEALLDELVRRGFPLPVVFADNDRTKQGRRLRNRDIISPADTNPLTDLVVITTISAGDQVSAQLETLGFERDVSYFEVMQKLDYLQPFGAIEFYEKYIDEFQGLDVLHVGPGGHLGVEVLLHALGARSVCSVEYHAFRLKYPDVTDARDFYEGLRRTTKKRWDKDLFDCGVLKSLGDRLLIDSDRIRLLYPCTVTALPFSDESFDVVLHHAVFEHVPDPEKGYREIFRVLRRGGSTIGLVDPQDHRNFSSFEEYHPLKFLEYSRPEWYEIARSINFHNEVTTPEHKKMIQAQGFSIQAWEVLMKMDVPEGMWRSFHSMFRELPRSEIGILRFGFFASRPNEP